MGAGGVTITVEHLQRGQPESYAPHTYESRLTFEGKNSWDLPLEDQVRELARTLVHPFTDEPDDGTMNGHFKARLKKLELLSSTQSGNQDGFHGGTDVWLVRIEEPYCD